MYPKYTSVSETCIQIRNKRKSIQNTQKNVLLAGDTKNTAKSDLLAFISCTSLCRLHFGSFGPEIKQNWEKMTKSS